MTMSSQIEHLILASVLTDVAFGKKYLPHLGPAYFSSVAGGTILIDVASRLVTNYGSALSLEQVHVELKGRRGDPEAIQDARELAADLYELAKEPPPNASWLADRTVEFINRERQRYLMEQMVFARDEGSDIMPFLKELSTPLVIEEEIEGFDSTAPDFVSRLAKFNLNNILIPFEDKDLNKMCGGIRPGTLGVVCTGTNVGKSLTLQHFTSGYLRQGRNVLYFSGELKAGSVANRILANLTGTSVDLIKKMPQGEIASIWSDVAVKIGRMVIHEYGTGTGNVMMFRSYIEQLQNRNGFKPDVIVVDHIQNCKPTGNATGLNLYQSYGLVAKELRQLAQELDIPVWSAAQANRQGQNGRLDLTNIGDSLQIVQDADTVLMMWRDESLPDYVHVSVPKRREAGSRGEGMFVMDTARMKLFELDAGARMAVQDAHQKKQSENRKKPAKKAAVLFDIDTPGALQ